MSTATDVPMTLEMTRVVAAPRELVWEAWTDAEQLAVWWGPKGFTNPVCEIDVRVGGAILIHMTAPNGAMHPMTGEYLEVVPPERLVFTAAALDPEGKPMFVNRNTIVFRGVAGGTEISVSVKVMSTTTAAPQYLKGMEMGWSTSLEKLTTLLETQQ
jgi:uncharacterized protein YndB with AHSA1/START domain